MFFHVRLKYYYFNPYLVMFSILRGGYNLSRFVYTPKNTLPFSLKRGLIEVYHLFGWYYPISSPFQSSIKGLVLKPFLNLALAFGSFKLLSMAFTGNARTPGQSSKRKMKNVNNDTDVVEIPEVDVVSLAPITDE